MTQPILLNDQMMLTIIQYTDRFPPVPTTKNAATDDATDLFSALVRWRDTSVDFTTRTKYWLAFVKYLLAMLNDTPEEFEIKFRFNDMTTGIIVNAAGDIDWHAMFNYPADYDAYDLANDPATDYPIIFGNLSTVEYLANYSMGECFLELSDGYNPQAVTTKVEIKGSFLKILGISPNDQISLRLDERVPVSISTRGHDYIQLRCLQSKNAIDGTMQQTTPRETDLICIIPCRGGLDENIYYHAQHTGSKLHMKNTSLDNVDLMFYDKWGAPLYGMIDFLVELTVDFVKLGSLESKVNATDVRNMLL